MLVERKTVRKVCKMLKQNLTGRGSFLFFGDSAGDWTTGVSWLCLFNKDTILFQILDIMFYGLPEKFSVFQYNLAAVAYRILNLLGHF